MAALDDYCEEHISRGEDRLFSGYQIAVYEGADLEPGNVDADQQRWTVAKLIVDRDVSAEGARRIMNTVDTEINLQLPPDQKPERLVYFVMGYSSVNYWAKSQRIQGHLPALQLIEQLNTRRRRNYHADDADDADATPPVSPPAEYASTGIIEVQITL
ncbi:hypothetical protein F5X96DRAFT_654615 [Biscogniauxia mediterranea]|nr:hypothetical protein F5X96DRAFT_654615 [Biscogniauxia mediterranea]